MSTLHVLYNPEVADVDIVAVTGLYVATRDNPPDHWTDTITGFSWLKDGLPQLLPTARVMLLSNYIKSITEPFDLDDFSMQLLDTLLEQRELAEDRPLVFIGHSLGGLIVKNAVIKANLYSRYKHLLEAICGILFLGTPHQGNLESDLVSVSSSAAFETIGDLRQGNADLVRKLLAESRFLRSIRSMSRYNDEFAQLKIPKVSFYEMRVSSYSHSYVVSRRSASLDGSHIFPMNSDHVGLVRFEGPDDPNYKTVSREIQKFVMTGIKEQSSSVRNILLSAPINEILLSAPINEIIVAVIGDTGAGKSTFVKMATGSQDVNVGHEMDSSTVQVEGYPCQVGDWKITLVDTPGFDDTSISDENVFVRLANWLEFTYAQGSKLSGLIYLYDITQNRLRGSTLRYLDVFRKIIGPEALPGVTLVTTHWDLQREEGTFERREQELHSIWRHLIESGSSVDRFSGDQASALRILSKITLTDRKLIPLNLQSELVDQQKSLESTEAGKTFATEVEAIHKRSEQIIEEMRRDIEIRWSERFRTLEERIEFKSPTAGSSIDRPPTYSERAPAECIMRLDGCRHREYFEQNSMENVEKSLAVTELGNGRFFAATVLRTLHHYWPGLGALLLKGINGLVQKIPNAVNERTYAFTIPSAIDRPWIALIRFEEREPSMLKIHIIQTFTDNYSEAASEAWRQDIQSAFLWLFAFLIPRSDSEGLCRSLLVANESSSSSDYQVYWLHNTRLELDPESSCWTHLFRYVTIVSGSNTTFSPGRSTPPPGLLINLHELIRLASVTMKVQTNRGLLLMGFQTALIPLERQRDFPDWDRWHFQATQGTQITTQICDTNLSLDRRESARLDDIIVSVGWTNNSKLYLGNEDPGADCAPLSCVPKVDIVLQKAEIARAAQAQLQAGGSAAVASLSGSIGLQYQSASTYGSTCAAFEAQSEYLALLDQARTFRVFLWDSASKKAWLVPGTSLLVYGITCYARINGYSWYRPQVVAGAQPANLPDLLAEFTFALPSAEPDIEARAALEANSDLILRRNNLGLGYHVKDLVRQIWFNIIRGIDSCRNHVTRDILAGENILTGFDFREALNGLDIHLRAEIVKGSIKSWKPLAEGYIVVFARGIGEVIRSETCAESVLAHQAELSAHTAPGILTAMTRDLQQMYGELWEGLVSPEARPITTSLQWRMRSSPFGACIVNPATPTSTCSSAERLQSVEDVKLSVASKSKTRITYAWSKAKLKMRGHGLLVSKDPRVTHNVANVQGADTAFTIASAVRFGIRST